MSTHNVYIFGLHSVAALLQANPARVITLHVQRERKDKKIEEILQLARQKNVHLEMVPRTQLNDLTEESQHQGVVAVCKPPRIWTEAELKQLLMKLAKPALVLVLDGVQDPHNLGACFRSANAAGVDAIIAPKDNAVGMTAVVSKVASGAAELIPFVQVTNLVRTLEVLKKLGLWIYGAAAEAKTPLYQIDFKGPSAIVLGAEGAGLRRLTKEHCDELIHIPMQGAISSLNVSVAAGVLLFEVVRQRIVS